MDNGVGDSKPLLPAMHSLLPHSSSSSWWSARMSSPVPVRRDVVYASVALWCLLLLYLLYDVLLADSAPHHVAATTLHDLALAAAPKPTAEQLWLEARKKAGAGVDDASRGHQWMYVQTLHYGDYRSSLDKLNELSYLTARARCFAVLQDYSYVINLGPEEMRAAMTEFVQSFPEQSLQSKLGMTAFGFDRLDPANPSRVVHMPALSGPWYRVLLLGLALYQPQLLLQHSSMSFASSKLRDVEGRVRPMDYVVFSDVDAVISNASRPLDELIRALPPRCWLVVQDLEYVANAGVVIMRQSLEARQFVTLWLEQWLSREPGDYWQADQGAMMEAILIWLSQRSAKYKGKLDYPPGLCWHLQSNNDSAIHEHPALRWMLTWTTAEGKSQEQVWIQNACFGSILKHWGFAVKERINLDGVCLLPVYDSAERPDQQVYRFNCHWCGQQNDWFIHHEINRDHTTFFNYTKEKGLTLGKDEKCQFPRTA